MTPREIAWAALRNVYPSLFTGEPDPTSHKALLDAALDAYDQARSAAVPEGNPTEDVQELLDREDNTLLYESSGESSSLPDELANCIKSLAARLAEAERHYGEAVSACGLRAQERDAAIARADGLREALEEVRPYFEGEHHPDHPACRAIQAALNPAPTGQGEGE